MILTAAATGRPLRIPASRRSLRTGAAPAALLLPLALGAPLGLGAGPGPAAAQSYVIYGPRSVQQVLKNLTYSSEVRVVGDVIVSGATAVLGDERPWLVVNEGTVKGDGTDSDAVALLEGGSVVNEAGALLDGSRYGLLLAGGAGSVTNDGRIVGIVAGIDARSGLALANGTAVADGAEIKAVEYGIRVFGGPALIENDGRITATAGVGLLLQGGGSVSNRGIIEGGALGLRMSSGDVLNQGIVEGARGLEMLGGTFTNGGTLRGLGESAATLGGGAHFVNGAGALVEGAGAAIVGTGPAVVENAGTLRGVAGFSLDLGAGDDLLILSTGSRLEGEGRAGAGLDSLRLTGSGGEDDRLTGFERLEVAAGAEWSLAGLLEASEAAQIAGRLGLLGAQGRLATAEARVLSGGSLFGDGAVLAALEVEPGGRLAPGNGLGTLTVTGPFALSNGGVLEIEVAQSGASDRLAVGGAASLDGELEVTVLDRVAAGQSFLVLTAGDGISGGFDSISDNFALFGFESVRVGDELFLKVVGVPIGDAVTTPNEGATGGAIGEIIDGTNGDTGNAALDELLDAIQGGSEEELAALLGQLSGDTYASATLRLALAERAFLEGLAGRSLTHWHGREEVGHLARRGQLAAAGRQELAAGPLPSRDPRGGGWLELSGAHAEVEDGNAGDLEEEGYGATLGYDVRLSELGAELELLFGAALGIASLELDNFPHRASASGSSYRAALYGRLTEGPLTLAAALGGSLGSLESERHLLIGDFEERASGGGDTASLGLAVEGAWGLAVGQGVELVPLLGLAYGEARQEGFRESGAPGAGLSVAPLEAESLSSHLALRISQEFRASGTLLLEPEARIGWRHEYLDRATPMTARFTAAPSGLGSFGVTGAEGAADLLTLAAALTASWGDGTYLAADYELEAAEEEARHSLAFSLRVTF